MAFSETKFGDVFRFTLPCAKECPFGRRCGLKYFEEDGCMENIERATKEHVSSYSSEKSTKSNGDLSFSVADPIGRVVVSEGEIAAWRV